MYPGLDVFLSSFFYSIIQQFTAMPLLLNTSLKIPSNACNISLHLVKLELFLYLPSPKDRQVVNISRTDRQFPVNFICSFYYIILHLHDEATVVSASFKTVFQPNQAYKEASMIFVSCKNQIQT